MAQERVHGDVPRSPRGMRILIDVVVAAVMVAPLVLVGAGGWLLVQRQTGERVQAEVLSCDLDLGHRTASQHCTARWTQDGIERIGPIQGSGDQQVGKRVTATPTTVSSTAGR